MTTTTPSTVAEPAAAFRGDKRPAVAWWSRIIPGRRPRTVARVPRSTVALLVTSLILPLALFGLAAYHNWLNVERAAKQHVERTTQILHEHALKIFETHELMLDQINERLRTFDWSNARDVASLHEALSHLQRLVPQVVDIIVTDATGHIRAESLTAHPNPEIDLSDRDYFAALKAADQELPYISRAVLGRRTGMPIFNMAARVSGRAANRFDGVVVIAIDQSYFGDQTIEHQYAQTIVLEREDGSMLASQPPMRSMSLPSGTLEPLWKAKRHAGAMVRDVVIDGTRSIFGCQKVGAYPVMIGYAVTGESAFAPWWRNMRGYGLVALLSSVALLGVSGFAIRRIRLEGNATKSWRQSAALLKTEIAERARVEEQLRQAQKMEAVGRLTGGIAHDFNNLLTVVIGNLDLLSRRMPDADTAHRALVQNAVDGATRAAALTARLLAFSRQQPLDPKTVDATVLVSGMTDLLGRTLGEAIAIDLKLADDLWLTLADPNQLENAVLNLCVNAVDAMPKGGVLTISTGNVTLDRDFCAKTEGLKPGDFVALTVGDTGSGMPADVIERAFEPFFTTKPVGKGTGLGLSQLYGFARQSGGHAEIDSKIGRGTIVRLYLPRIQAVDVRAMSDEPSAREAPVQARTSGATVLVVEDDEFVRKFSASILRDAGYRVVEAETGVDGLRELRRHPEIGLIFTDVVLKGSMNGRELADKAALMRPGLPILFTTGYTKDAIAHEGHLDEGANLIGKPFTTAALTARIAEMLATEGQAARHSAVA